MWSSCWEHLQNVVHVIVQVNSIGSVWESERRVTWTANTLQRLKDHDMNDEEISLETHLYRAAWVRIYICTFSNPGHFMVLLEPNCENDEHVGGICDIHSVAGKWSSELQLCLVGMKLYLHIDCYFRKKKMSSCLKQASQGDGGVGVKAGELQQPCFIMFASYLIRQSSRTKTDCPVFLPYRLFCWNYFFFFLSACLAISQLTENRWESSREGILGTYFVVQLWFQNIPHCHRLLTPHLKAGLVGRCSSLPLKSTLSPDMCFGPASLQHNFFNISVQVQNATGMHFGLRVSAARLHKWILYREVSSTTVCKLLLRPL